MEQNDIKSLATIINKGLDKVSYGIKTVTPDIVAVHSGRAWDAWYDFTTTIDNTRILLKWRFYEALGD